MEMNISMISVEELDGIINNENYVIVDVRDTEEYNKNHIPGAIHISMNQIRQAQFDKEKIIVLYCEHGGNSMVAARELARRGFQVKTLVGGMRAYMGRY